MKSSAVVCTGSALGKEHALHFRVLAEALRVGAAVEMQGCKQNHCVRLPLPHYLDRSCRFLGECLLLHLAQVPQRGPGPGSAMVRWLRSLAPQDLSLVQLRDLWADSAMQDARREASLVQTRARDVPRPVWSWHGGFADAGEAPPHWCGSALVCTCRVLRAELRDVIIAGFCGPPVAAWLTVHQMVPASLRSEEDWQLHVGGDSTSHRTSWQPSVLARRRRQGSTSSDD
jgi:hypothetical protein